MKQETGKSLTKALGILKLFLEGKHEMSLGEISKLSKLNKSTVNRIVSVFVKEKYLKQQEKRGKYSLGTIYLNFGTVVKNTLQIRNIAVPYLIKLSQKTNEATLIALGNRMENMIVETIDDSSHKTSLLRVGAIEGSELPMHGSATGKIILENMSEEELQTYFNSKHLKRFTPNTIMDINVMKNHLLTMRQEGVAFDDEEYSLGIRGIASGLRDSEGVLVGAISLLAPSVRLSRERMRELAPDIKNCAIEISRQLGFRG